MAARIEAVPPPHPVHVIDLRRVTTAQMEPLLQEETAEWAAGLEWDFVKSADLVRRFVDLRALSGCALLERGEVIGYSYYVVEESKGLIGDLYVRRQARSVARENLLLRK